MKFCESLLKTCTQVILATHPSCDLGHSRTLLADWATSPNNTIVFVERAQVGLSLVFSGQVLQVRFCRSGFVLQVSL